MKTTGTSIFTPVTFGKYTFVTEHTQDLHGMSLLRAVDPDGGLRQPFRSPRGTKVSPPMPHSFKAWHAAHGHHDFTLWCEEEWKSSHLNTSACNPVLIFSEAPRMDIAGGAMTDLPVT